MGRTPAQPAHRSLRPPGRGPVVRITADEQIDKLFGWHEPLVVKTELGAGGNVICEQSQRPTMSEE